MHNAISPTPARRTERADMTKTWNHRCFAFLGAATVLAASATVFAIPPATASSPQSHLDVRGPAVQVSPATGRGRILYSQNDHDAGDGIVSDHTGGDYYDDTSRGADDFTINSGSWVIREIDITGVYRFDTSVTSENVAFYADRNGLPGAALARFDHVVGNDDGSGSFNISLGNGVILPAGHYWVSVQVNDKNGFWVWQTTSELHQSPAAWKNPRDGFDTGCLQFANMQDCAGDLGEGPDFMYLLQGAKLGHA